MVWVSKTVTCVFIASSVWEFIINNGHTRTTERTLNTRRILLRSDLQAEIASLPLLAWKSRESTFRLPCLMTFLWISVTALKPGRMFRQHGTQNEYY